MIRAALAALLALAPAAASAADTPVDLLAGHDYMLSANGDTPATVTLAAPGGTAVASVQVTNSDDQPGDEFRARYSADYTLRVDPSDAANVFDRVEPDCRGSPATLCHISVNHTRRGKFSASYDGDWFAATLLAGRAYRISYQGGLGADVGVRDARGRDLVPEMNTTSGVLTFRPRAKGRYFISVRFDDFSGSGSPFYTLGLR